MSLVMDPPPMARIRRNDTAVKVDKEVIRQAKVVSAIREITLAEYLSAVLAPIVERDYEVALNEAKKPKPKRP